MVRDATHLSGDDGSCARSVVFLEPQMWNTRAEIQAAEEVAEEAAKQIADNAYRRALYEDEVLLADVARMLDQESS